MSIILFLGKGRIKHGVKKFFKRFARSSRFSAVMLPSLRCQVILLGILDVFDTDLNNDQNFLGLA